MCDMHPHLLLYVAGNSPNSRRALSNLVLLRNRVETLAWKFETIDVYEQPDRAFADGVMMTPQLVIRSSSGTQIHVGDLSDHTALLTTLGINDGLA